MRKSYGSSNRKIIRKVTVSAYSHQLLSALTNYRLEKLCTLYRWFPSKDKLIEEVMKYRATGWLQWFETAVKERGNTPKERLLATFDVLREWYARPDFRGCPFINAVLEIADANHKAHHVSIDLRESIRQIIVRLATDAGVLNPEFFSQQYLLLIGGASLMATIEGKPDGATFAQKALSVLIDSSV